MSGAIPCQKKELGCLGVPGCPVLYRGVGGGGGVP